MFVAVRDTHSSDVKVSGSESCHENGLIRHGEKLGQSKNVNDMFPKFKEKKKRKKQGK